ncbi:hypothetical protein JL722_14342 [Aureococcus anophagefferens]|nr:hypothetical protein JL722_14342 [Aureococcus anophagefferens]
MGLFFPQDRRSGALHLPPIKRQPPAAKEQPAKQKRTLASQADWDKVRRIEPRYLQRESAAAAQRLRVSFGAWARGGAMSGATFAKLCRECGLVGSGFVATDIDASFASAAGGARKLSLTGFERAVSLVAAKRTQPLEAVAKLIFDAGGPKARGTEPESLGRLTDAALYTGSHKHRFDADGNGRGLDGRDSIPQGQRPHPCQRRAPAPPLRERGAHARLRPLRTKPRIEVAIAAVAARGSVDFSYREITDQASGRRAS